MEELTASTLLDADYVVFGNQRRGVLLPLASRVGIRAGIGMLGATRRSTIAAEALATAATSMIGARAVRGARRRLGDTVDREIFTAIWAQVESSIGAVDALAALERPQATRPGVAALAVIDRRVVAFVRMQPERAAAVNERDVLDAVAASSPRSFSVPAVLGAGAAGGWEWIATAPLPTYLHRGDWTSDPYAIGREISASLGTVLGPPPCSGWVPIHGDLAPWNLRRSGRRTILIDWESVDHGPPAADAVYLVANRAAMRGNQPDALDAEAARFWLERLAQRVGSGLDHRLTKQLNDIFRRFAS